MSNNEGYKRSPIPNPPSPLGFKGAFHWNRGPRAPWGKAISASITIGIPFMIGALFNHMEWALLASMGGFTALYVHNETYAERARKLFFVLIGMVLSFGVGLATSASPLMMTLAFVSVSTLSTYFSNAFKMPPPGSYFFILVCAVGTIIPFDPSLIPFRMGMALVGGVMAWLIAMCGWLWNAYNQETSLVIEVYQDLARFMASIGTAESDQEKHNLLLSLKLAEKPLLKGASKKDPKTNKSAYLLNLVEKANDLFLAVIEAEVQSKDPINQVLVDAVQEVARALKQSEAAIPKKLDTFADLDPILIHLKDEVLIASHILNNKIPISPLLIRSSDQSVWRVFRSSFSNPSAVLPGALRIGIAVLVASLLSIFFGNERPYWVTLACASALQGATVWAIVNRTLQRSVGTAVGILIGGLILSLHVNAWELVLVVMTLQFIIELFIVRNYTVAVTFITPMALIITHFSGLRLPIPTLIGARLVDTILGTAVALLAGLFLWHKSASTRLPMVMKLVIKFSGELLQDLMREESISETSIVKKRTQLLNMLVVLRNTYDGALNEIRKSRWVDSYWSSVIAMQRLGSLIGATSSTRWAAPKNDQQIKDVQSVFETLYEGIDQPKSNLTIPTIVGYPGVNEEIQELYESLQMIQHEKRSR